MLGSLFAIYKKEKDQGLEKIVKYPEKVKKRVDDKRQSSYELENAVLRAFGDDGSMTEA